MEEVVHQAYQGLACAPVPLHGVESLVIFPSILAMLLYLFYFSSICYYSSLFHFLITWKDPSYLRQSTSNSTLSVVNPITSTIFMSGGTLRYNLPLNIPVKPAKLDVLVMVDTTGMLTNLLYLFLFLIYF